MSREVDFVGAHAAGDYGSEFEYDSEADRAKKKRHDLADKSKPAKHKVASKNEVTEEYNKEEGRKMRYHVLSMDAYSRHKKFINDYLMYFGGSREDFKRDTSRDKTDIDIIHENHRFLWSHSDRAEETWEKHMAKKYHDKLFKEYCITDLSRYKENKIAMRWRIEKEVIAGKGQFMCGNKRCESNNGLRTWEVNFGYVEHGEKKNALVKLRLCPDCSYKLNYHKKRREVTKKKRRKIEDDDKETKRRKGESQDSCHGDGENPSTESDGATAGTSGGGNLWSGPAKISEDKSREEEYEDYFEDMFL